MINSPLFIRIPKTATCSIAATQLFDSCAGRNYGMWDENLTKKFSMILKAQVPNWDERFKFAFVRNPFDRIVSSWSNFNGKLFSMDFDSYLEFIVRNTATTVLEGRILWHASPMLYHLTDYQGNITIDQIGRYESLVDDFNKIVNLLGMSKVDLPAINVSRHSCYRDYYTVYTRNIIESIFEEDLNYFNYDY